MGACLLFNIACIERRRAAFRSAGLRGWNEALRGPVMQTAPHCAGPLAIK